MPTIDRASPTSLDLNGEGHMSRTQDVAGTGEQPPVADSALSANAVDRLIEHRKSLHRRLTIWLGDADAAEDALQSAYERALSRGGTLRLEDSVIPWFSRLLHNVAVDQKRKQSSERRAVEFWSRDEGSSAPSSYQADLQTCRCVLGVLEDLRPAYREVLHMVEIDGRTPTEAAATLGTTVNNLRVRLHRSRTALRDRLVAVCGTRARRGCSDCSCGGPARRPERV